MQWSIHLMDSFKILFLVKPFQIWLLHVCISITEADVISISMYSQRYDTLKIHMKQLAMRYNSPPLRCSAIRFQCYSMQWKKIWLLLFLWFKQTALRCAFMTSFNTNYAEKVTLECLQVERANTKSNGVYKKRELQLNETKMSDGFELAGEDEMEPT